MATPVSRRISPPPSNHQTIHHPQPHHPPVRGMSSFSPIEPSPEAVDQHIAQLTNQKQLFENSAKKNLAKVNELEARLVNECALLERIDTIPEEIHQVEEEHARVKKEHAIYASRQKGLFTLKTAFASLMHVKNDLIPPVEKEFYSAADAFNQTKSFANHSPGVESSRSRFEKAQKANDFYHAQRIKLTAEVESLKQPLGFEPKCCLSFPDIDSKIAATNYRLLQANAHLQAIGAHLQSLSLSRQDLEHSIASLPSKIDELKKNIDGLSIVCECFNGEIQRLQNYLHAGLSFSEERRLIEEQTFIKSRLDRIQLWRSQQELAEVMQQEAPLEVLRANHVAALTLLRPLEEALLELKETQGFLLNCKNMLATYSQDVKNASAKMEAFSFYDPWQKDRPNTAAGSGGFKDAKEHYNAAMANCDRVERRIAELNSLLSISPEHIAQMREKCVAFGIDCGSNDSNVSLLVQQRHAAQAEINEQLRSILEKKAELNRNISSEGHRLGAPLPDPSGGKASFLSVRYKNLEGQLIAERQRRAAMAQRAPLQRGLQEAIPQGGALRGSPRGR